MNIKLKPCPFCGSKSLKLEGKSRQFGYRSVSVRCNVCYARGGTASTGGVYILNDEAEEEAIELWNKRCGE